MIRRWVGLGLERAAARFRRIKGHREVAKSDPISLDTVWTTMTAAKEAGHARQEAEVGRSWQ